MSIKSSNLKKILLGKYIPIDEPTIIDSTKLIGNRYESEFLVTYQSLDGIENFPKLIQKGYFFETIKFAVAFDEQLSFNKYRLKTLRSDIYQHFHGLKLDKYRIYCKKYERECLKSGTANSIWTNGLAEKYFGASELPGDLGLKGSAGWKLKALYDYTEDMYSIFAKKRLLRISVWDEILINNKLQRIGELLNTPGKETAEHILKFVERRVINLFA